MAITFQVVILLRGLFFVRVFSLYLRKYRAKLIIIGVLLTFLETENTVLHQIEI